MVNVFPTSSFAQIHECCSFFLETARRKLIAKNKKPAKDQHEPSDWQLFTNNGLFNSVFPPSQRFSSKAKAFYKNYNTVILKVPTYEKRNKCK